MRQATVPEREVSKGKFLKGPGQGAEIKWGPPRSLNDEGVPLFAQKSHTVPIPHVSDEVFSRFSVVVDCGKRETKAALGTRDTSLVPTRGLKALETTAASPFGRKHQTCSRGRGRLKIWVTTFAHTPLGVTGSNFEMKPEPRHPPAFGLHFEVRAGHLRNYIRAGRVPGLARGLLR